MYFSQSSPIHLFRCIYSCLPTDWASSSKLIFTLSHPDRYFLLLFIVSAVIFLPRIFLPLSLTLCLKSLKLSSHGSWAGNVKLVRIAWHRGRSCEKGSEGSTHFLELMLTALLILLSENAGSAGIWVFIQLIASHRSLTLLIFILSFFSVPPMGQSQLTYF